MQDKNIAISELKKLIENCKGKSVETQFNKPSVVRQPNAQRIPKPSNPPREKVGSNDMVHNYYLEKAKKSAQLQKDKEVNGKPSMDYLPNYPTLLSSNQYNRNWQASMIVCLYSANHDECVLEYLSRLDVKSHKTTKRYMPVVKSSASKKPKRQIPTGHRFSHKKTTTVPEKTRTPRSCLRWQPTGRILKTVCLRWVPTGKLLNSCTGKVEKMNPHMVQIQASVFMSRFEQSSSSLGLHVKRRLITADQASVFIGMMSVHISSGLVLHQMTSDHNRSELGFQDHSNEPSSQSMVLKFVSSSKQDTTSRRRIVITIPPSYSNAETTGTIVVCMNWINFPPIHAACLEKLSS
ncbi:hypothetical protein Tco_0682034 [Tanacetum coccineum]|uniref:Uncharacterized protein n=1 Tax=Tanacetum coccineum TaxID=301880 RepID=A0ABQ4XQ41_9ASTR